jgi:hypothetical protein
MRLDTLASPEHSSSIPTPPRTFGLYPSVMARPNDGSGVDDLHALMEEVNERQTRPHGMPMLPRTMTAIRLDADIVDLIPTFYNNRLNDIATLRATFGRGDFVAAARIGHGMKGSGATYGFNDITEFGRLIERAATDRDLTTLLDAVTELDLFMATVCIDDNGNNVRLSEWVGRQKSR